MYYGGRDISEEDLEKALLIGLSPHERRKLERKKGVSFKHSAEVAGMDKQEGNHIISIGQGTLKVVLVVSSVRYDDPLLYI